MKPLTPWRSEPEPAADVVAARQALEAALPNPGWSDMARAASWRRFEDRAFAPSAPRRWVLGLSIAGWATAAALALLLAWPHHRAPSPGATAAQVASTDAQEPDVAGWQPLSLGSEGSLRIREGSKVELQTATGNSGRHVMLREGTLCAAVAHRDPTQAPFSVETPHLRATDMGTHFCVDVAAAWSSVTVTEGRVRVENAFGRSAEVPAGEMIRSDDARLSASLVPIPSPAVNLPTLRGVVPTVKGCAASATVDQRMACYSGVAAGSGLAAQNALYGLAVLARDDQRDAQAALRYFRTYQDRFPRGVLGPEASLGVASLLIAERRYAEAVGETDRYLKSYPEGLVTEVSLAKAKLLQEGLHSPGAALPVYLGLLASDLPPSLRQEVLYSMGLCERAEGDLPAARALERRYLATYPHGVHASQVRDLAVEE